MNQDEHAVAVVGMSCRFPGATDLEEYWRVLVEGRTAIVDLNVDQLGAAGVSPSESTAAGYVPARGALTDTDRFDADLFGFSAVEAAALDPQHRLLLETAWAAVEDAGRAPTAIGLRTGVYVGGSPTDHARLAPEDPALLAALGPMALRVLTDREFLAGWLAYRLGFDGPALTVQTACSTSLSAVHLATQALLLGECDAAVAGGVSLAAVHARGYRHQEGGILSPDGRCRPFDTTAGGTVPGDGVGVVVLRRLADALADGDPVRAVIAGSAITNDGATRVGFTSPGVDRQTAAITEAWAAAGLDPADAQYLEMHGTGTAIGDRVELAAVTAALPARHRCAIGSVKSTIGHLDAAAGVAGLVKTVLMLQHRTLVPTAEVASPRPEVVGAEAVLRLASTTEQWPTSAGTPRRAGVSSLGIGGTNVHVALTEATPTTVPPVPVRPEVLAVSAASAAQLRELGSRLAAVLRGPAPPRLADVAHTLRVGRTMLAVRAAVVAVDPTTAAAALATLTEGTVVGDAGDAVRAWVAGADDTAGTSTPGARRVALPTYPFADVRHPVLTASSAVADAPSATAGPDGHHDAVATIVREVLGLDADAPLTLTYFAAGGDSLAAVHLVGRLRDELDIDVPITVLLDDVTLAELIHTLAEPDRADPLADLLDEMESAR